MLKLNSIPKKVFLDLVSDQSGLWLIDLEKQPYHLGISTKGRYHSLRFRTKDDNLECETLFTLLRKKKLSIGFIPLNIYLSENHISEAFSTYTSCQENSCSCIRPILDIFDQQGDKKTIFDLLDYFIESGQVDQAYVVNEENQDVDLQMYTYEIVQDNLLNPCK
jgi:hypothetical protein